MKNRYEMLWLCSLVVILIITIILVGADKMGIVLPDIAVRIIGTVDLILIAIFAFATVKKSQLKGRK